MASSIATSLLRRSLRLRLSSAPSLRQGRSLFTRSSIFASSHGVALLEHTPASSRVFSRFASYKISGDENLKRVIESEIQCAQQSDAHGQEIDVPKDFPFEIVDVPGDQAVILKRKFSGESIQVTVMMNLDERNELDEDDEETHKENGISMEPALSLVVTIEKGEGPLLELCCQLNPNELAIEAMAIKKLDDLDNQLAYQGPEFSDLDENLQKAMLNYLEVRGINISLFDFLHDYRLDKDDREYLMWLKNIKEFIA